MTARRLALLLVTTLALAVTMACDDDEPQPATPSGSATAAAAPRVVNGLFSGPRETVVDDTVVLTEPNVEFLPWDRRSTVVYFLKSGTEQDLGAGSSGRFSPDGTRMVWVAGEEATTEGQARMIDLGTNEMRDLGPARLVNFKDDATVWLVPPDQNYTLEVDLATGAEQRREGVLFSGFMRPPPRAGNYELSYTDTDAPRAVVRDISNDVQVLYVELETYSVAFAGDERLAVVTGPVNAGPEDERGYRLETANLFLVDIASGTATFVATVTGYGGVFPVAASKRHVVWTDNYCTLAGMTQRAYVLDIDASRITAIDAELFPAAFSPAGLLISGPFGGRELIDLDEFALRIELPGGEPVWSENGLYASIGQVGGHGGVCP